VAYSFRLTMNINNNKLLPDAVIAKRNTMDTKENKLFIKKALNNAALILKDNDSFLYLICERQDDVKKYNLGNGTIASAIALFALINFISKIFVILENGSSVIVTEEDIEEFGKLKAIVKEKNKDEWKDIEKYLKKPRIGDINETEAFVELIINCPIDFGIDKADKEVIKHIWRIFRNKLTHLISLAGNEKIGQMLIQEHFGPSQEGNYHVCLPLLQSRSNSYKAFSFLGKEAKELFLNKTDIDDQTLQYIVKDKCYVVRLNIACKTLIDWLIEKIGSNYFSDENLAILVKWLGNELRSTEED
jgi:hypothetical protein